MSKHRSFRPSDFSIRDVPGLLVGYLIISVIFVLCGLMIEAFPPFGRGTLFGLGVGLVGALFLLREKREIDIGSLPEPSENVRRKCQDPACTFPSPRFVEAVKIYRDETGASLIEATEVLKGYVAKWQSQQ
ncbi:MAG: hypothetical protein ACI8W8_000214 [Rhodothermales bacterium]|jgi:hypothetical protein